MFLKNEDVAYIIKGVIAKKGVADAENLTKAIMEKLEERQKAKAKKGSEVADHPKKHINFDSVKKQIKSGVSLNKIAASEGVSEQTLRRRLKEV